MHRLGARPRRGPHHAALTCCGGAGYRHDPAVRAARPQLPFRYEGVAAADAVDWRAAGAVTGVKDQGQCGSCWAFSTTGSLEGANFVVNGQLVSLSEQELIECDRSGNDRGCNGGLMDYAYEWIISNGGIDTEKDYPYTGTDEVCDTTKEHTVAVAVASFEDIPPNNEAAIKKAVTVQPVSIAIAASGLPFQLYSHGVFNGSCSTQLDHGVLIVGYDTDKETGADYWIVKNSWGEVWGDAGFVKMAMHHAPSGLCGLAMVPSYPVVKKAGPPGPGPGPAPPPGPGPTPPATITCDSKSGSTCPSTATCCCSLKIPYINYCVQWGCCPYVAATCCSDGSSCCPADHPVCDLDNGVCAASSALGASSALDTMPLGHKFAATRDFSRSSLLHFVSAAAAEDKE